jgi:hypothetical protein
MSLGRLKYAEHWFLQRQSALVALGRIVLRAFQNLI